MVTNTSDSSSDHHSPKNLPSPWAQVVRCADSDPSHQSSPFSFSSSLESVNSNCSSIHTCDAAVKTAWKRPSNGVSEIGPVMGAVTWPALCESTTKPTAKSTSDSTLKTTADYGSLTITPQEPIIANSPRKQTTEDAKTSPVMNSGMVNRQRSVKRGGSNGNNAGSGPVQNNFLNTSPNRPPPPPPFPVLQMPPSSFVHGIPGVPVRTSRDPYRNNNWDTRPPLGGFIPPMNDHRAPSRRGHPRGDSPRGNFANNRDPRANQQRTPPRGLMRPLPPHPSSFMGPMRSFPNPAGFPEFYYLPTLQFEPFGGVPFFAHAPPSAMFLPVAETTPTNTIVSQIDYYFSDANLVKDEYLRSNMDEQGWVPIALIASFPRVRSLTSNIKLILDSLRTSTVVEVQDDKLRRRNVWMKWLPTKFRANSVSISPCGSSSNNLAVDFEKIIVDEATNKVNAESIRNDVSVGVSCAPSQVPDVVDTDSSN